VCHTLLGTVSPRTLLTVIVDAKSKLVGLSSKSAWLMGLGVGGAMDAQIEVP